MIGLFVNGRQQRLVFWRAFWVCLGIQNRINDLKSVAAGANLTRRADSGLTGVRPMNALKRCRYNSVVNDSSNIPNQAPACNAVIRGPRPVCGKPAIPGKAKCAQHGGLSTGPKTPEGRARCAAAKLIHGRETRALRDQRSQIQAALRLVEDRMFAAGVIRGPRTRGRKPGHSARPDLVSDFLAGLLVEECWGGSAFDYHRIHRIEGVFP